MSFVLIDPSPFQATETDKIEIMHNTYFTDELAKKFQARDNLLFISDIRSRENRMEKQCEIEMENQKRWHKIINPKASMFKFRLPYAKGTSKYLDGKIYLPVWGGRTSTEARLVCTTQQEKEYDHTEYGSQMFHFNTVTRTTYFEHNVVGEGIDHCFDCSSEIFILKKYLEKYSKDKMNSLDKQISKMSHDLSRRISDERTLEIS